MGFFEKVGKSSVRTMLKRKLSKKSPVPSDEAPAAPKAPRAADKSKDTLPPNKSQYFASVSSDEVDGFSQRFLDIQLELNSALKSLTFKPPVEYIYNPVEYASKPNESYVRKYCQGPKKLLFVGMNPGPFGMCQTGVPFGEIKSVRDWLGIEEEVEKPEKECPGRPVLGFACTRSEVSGDRLWNLIKKLCGTPDTFFRNCFVYNYCPLALLKKDGGNLTPSDIKKDAKTLEEICDRYFYQIVRLLEPETIVGIGRYVEARALAVLKENGSDTKVICLVHPSPRVKNNQNWPQKAEDFLRDQDLLRHMIP